MSDRSPMPVARRPATERGFTLIELMVALAILGILVGIAYPAYLDSVRKSRRGQAKADLLELAQRAERFHTQGNSYVGFGASLSAADLRSPRAGAAAYTLRVSDETANGYTLRAEPSGAQANDTACASLSLNQAGVKGSTGSAGAAHCW